MRQSNKNTVELKDVFLVAKSKMDYDLSLYKKRNKNCKVHDIKFYVFARVVTLYFTLMFKEIIIDGTIVKLYQRLGHLFAVKSKCTRYMPSRKVFYRDAENKVRVKYEKCNVAKTDFYWVFMFWDSPAKWRHYEFKPKIKWKQMLYKHYTEGQDYLDYTLNKYGGYASPNYANV